MANSIIQSIKTIAKSLVDNAGYDKTRGGMIVGVNDVTNTYSVKIDGITYNNVKTVDDATYNLGDMVKIVIPCNQATQMYISASIFSDSSLGNRVTNALTLAGDAEQLGLDNVVEIERVEGIAESKNKTFRQASAPTSGMDKGDIWVDTDDGNKMYIWDGTQWAFSGGGDGQDGLNNATILLYKRGATAPSKPTAEVTYTFADASLSPTSALNGWTQQIPTINGQPCWVIAATASATTATDTIDVTEWSTQIKFVEDGAQGATGATGATGANGVAWYAESSTPAATLAKVATIKPTTTNFTLSVGACVTVKFTYTNSADRTNTGFTLNVNSTGARRIQYTTSGGGVANLPSNGYLQANRIYMFIYDGTYWVLQYNYNSDTTDRSRYNISLTATTAISAGVLATINSSNNIVKLASGVSFDINKPILYVGTAYTTSALTQSNNYTMMGAAFNYANTLSGFTGTTGMPVYLVGTLSGTTFTITSPVFTTTAPTTADGKIYMLLGRLTTTTNGTLYADHPLFAYGTNGFCQYAPRTPVGQVEISIDTISYPNQTATLRAILFVDGILTTPTSYQWSYGDTPTTISGATSQTLNITSASAGGLGLKAKYNCTVTW